MKVLLQAFVFSSILGSYKQWINDGRKIPLQNFIETINDILGVDLINSTPDISDDMKQLILERRQAREKKDWAKSDLIRDKLLAQGISIRDTPRFSIWERV